MINLLQIAKVLSASFTADGEKNESECLSEEKIREWEAERALALSDRDALFARHEELQAVMLQRETEMMNLRREGVQLREFLRGIENQKLLHEHSVEQHCQDLVTELSHCRGELMSQFEEQREVHQLRSDYEHASDHLRECRQRLQVPTITLPLPHPHRAVTRPPQHPVSRLAPRASSRRSTLTLFLTASTS
jgi:uncharacterized membrane-anchored protein YhcB (DUF1043 family)